jgi:hypothetical protein
VRLFEIAEIVETNRGRSSIKHNPIVLFRLVARLLTK